MQTCETCRHWVTYEQSPRWSIQRENGWGICDQWVAGAKARTQIVSEYPHGDHELATAPDFGCIAHEPRE